jgi:hypothetical protein
MTQYPVLHFLERHGGWIAAVVGVVPFAGSVLAVALGATAWWLAGGILGTVVLFVAARSYVELIRLMTDMLLPK